MHFSLANLRAFMTDPLSFCSRMKQKHGDFFSLYLGHKKFYFAAHPEFAQQVLITFADHFKKSRLIFDKIEPITGKRGLVQLEDKEWEELRLITNQLFHRAAMANYPAVINYFLAETASVLRKHAQSKEPVDIGHLMVTYTIKTAARIIFGMENEQIVTRLAEHFIHLNYLCGIKMRRVFSLPLSIPTITNCQIKYLQKSIAREIQVLIKIAKTHSFPSLINILLAHLPQEEELIQDQLTTFLFAGYETTAASLAFTFYLLAKHPKLQTKLGDLDFIQAIYKEALRLYPPAWILAREVRAEMNMNGFDLRSGDNLILCVREIQRHADFWHQPENFLPERFFKKSLPHKFAFMPFGIGKRICSGMQFAFLEAQLAIRTLCSEFEFTLANDLPVETAALVTLHPQFPLMLKVKQIDR